MKVSRPLVLGVVIVWLVTLSAFIAVYFFRNSLVPGFQPNLTVLSYGSFLNSWGPGPELAAAFEKQTGLKVQFIDAGDAGLLLAKAKVFSPDVVVGLDGLSLNQAREQLPWREINPVVPVRGSVAVEPHEFLAIDHAPLAFIYRKGTIEPPKSLDDLLDGRFKNQIALEDPRVSSPGLQFLLWVLDEKGPDEAFQFLLKLRPNIQSVSESWSTAYGMFKKGQAKLVFSYLTSPVYHQVQEHDSSYAAAIFQSHVEQVEYVGVPRTCRQCEAGEKFAQFLLTPEAQVTLMKKNFMLPMLAQATNGTEFANVPSVKVRTAKNLQFLLQNRRQWLEKWQQTGL